MDAQGHWPRARFRPGARSPTALDQPHSTDVSSCNIRRLRGTGHVLDHPRYGALGGHRGQAEIENTKNCCVPGNHILVLEVSRGGNSHQSETNLIKKTPEAILPGARKGSTR